MLFRSLIMALVAPTDAPLWITIIQALLFVVYGARLSGFLLVRELKDIAFKKSDVCKETLGKPEKKMPIFVLATIWVFVSILYTMQVSPMFFRYANGSTEWIAPVIGFVVSIGGLVLEAVADKQKSEQKKENPHFVATKGLYKICRCPNYLGELVIWTGAYLVGFGACMTFWQWVIATIGYIGIVYVMFSGARRLEIRQNLTYGADPEYQAYVKKTPILLPFVPIYSVERHKWLQA